MKQFLKSDHGKLIISLILGFGLSTLFRKSCKDKNCIEFKSPPLDELDQQVYKYDDKCYLFSANPVTCSPVQKTIRFA
jgi:hypothetical protein